MMKRLLSKGGWLLRVTTATVLLVVIGLSLAPRVVSHISTSAVVNAPVIVIRSPLEGVVEAYSLDTGSVVTRGQTLVSLREAGTDQTKQAELEARVHIADAAAKAVRNRIAEIEALRDSLVRRHALYAAWHRRILKSEVEEDEALLRGAVARAASLGREVDRATTLRTRGIVAESRIDEIRTRLTEQRERVSEITARLNTRRLKLAAIGEGVLAGTDGTNTPYTQQRLDEIDLELAALHDELVDHLAELAATRAQLAKERDIFLRDNQVALNAPTRGIVWRSASSSGQPVLPGDEIVELLDCGSRFLEAYLPESLMGSIAIGDMAEVRLTGTSRTFQAPVVSILGHGARFDHVELAAQDNAPKAGKMRVLIRLSDKDLGTDAGLFCHVGRTAQVSLPRDVSQFAGLFDRLRVSVMSVTHWIGLVATSSSRS